MSAQSESLQPDEATVGGKPIDVKHLKTKRRARREAIAKRDPHRLGDELVLVFPDGSCELVVYHGLEEHYGHIRARVQRQPTPYDYFDDNLTPLVPPGWLVSTKAA